MFTEKTIKIPDYKYVIVENNIYSYSLFFIDSNRVEHWNSKNLNKNCKIKADISRQKCIN